MSCGITAKRLPGTTLSHILMIQAWPVHILITSTFPRILNEIVFLHPTSVLLNLTYLCLSKKSQTSLTI